MTTGVTFDTVRPQESTASGYKRMKASALFSILLGAFSWMPLSSAAEAAPFQQYLNGACTGSFGCGIDFPVVPAGRRLDITNASCYLRTSENVELIGLHLQVVNTPAGVTVTVVPLVPTYVDGISATAEVVFSANHSIFAFANAGQRFRVYVDSKNGMVNQFACHVSGQMQKVP